MSREKIEPGARVLVLCPREKSFRPPAVALLASLGRAVLVAGDGVDGVAGAGIHWHSPCRPFWATKNHADLFCLRRAETAAENPTEVGQGQFNGLPGDLNDTP